MRTLLTTVFRRIGTDSTIARNSMYLLVAEAAGRLINIIVTKIILLRYLGPEVGGTMSVVISYGLLAAVVGEFGISQAAVRQIARSRREDIPAIMGNVNVLRLIMSGIMIVGLWVSLFTPIGARYEPQVRTLIAIWACSIFFQNLRRNSEVIFLSQEKMKFQALFLLLNRIVAAAGVLVVVFLKLGLIGVFVAYMIADATDCTLAWLFARLKLVKPRYAVSRAALITLAAASFPFAMHLLATQIHLYADSVLIDWLAQGSRQRIRLEVGWYNSAYMIVVTLIFIPISVCSALYPSLSRAYQENRERLRSLFAHSFNLFFLLGPLCALPFFMVRYEFLVALLGSDFRPGADMLPWVIVALPLSFLASALSVFLAATNRQKVVTGSSFLNAGFSLALNMVLIPMLGGRGAGLTTSLTFGLAVLIQFVAVLWWFPQVFDWRRLAPIALLHTMGISVVLAVDTSSLAVRLVVLVVYGVAALAIARYLTVRRLKRQQQGLEH